MGCGKKKPDEELFGMFSSSVDRPATEKVLSRIFKSFRWEKIMGGFALWGKK